MPDKTVLITGCSSGIGEATAKHFAEHDWTVYATARDTTDLDELWNMGCETEELDVTRHEDVYSIINTIKSNEGLDCLINNAGYAQFGPVEDVSTTQLRQQLDVNLLGAHRLIRESLPLLKESNGTIINISSVLSVITPPGTGSYSASKAAVKALSDSLRVELNSLNVDVVLVEPGPVETTFDDTQRQHLNKLSPTPGYESVYNFLRQSNDDSPIKTSSPEKVAQVNYKAATQSTAPRIAVGRGSKTSMFLSQILPTRLRDWLFQRMFLSDPSNQDT